MDINWSFLGGFYLGVFSSLVGYWIIEVITTIRIMSFNYRIKPEDKIVPWTIADRKEFHALTLKIDNKIWTVKSWNINGIYFEYENIVVTERIFINYKTLSKQYKDIDGKPCGKVEAEKITGNESEI